MGEKIVYKYSGGQDDIAAIRIKKAKKSYSINSLTTNSSANYTWKFRRPCKVLIFNGARVLVSNTRKLSIFYTAVGTLPAADFYRAGIS